MRPLFCFLVSMVVCVQVCGADDLDLTLTARRLQRMLVDSDDLMTTQNFRLRRAVLLNARDLAQQSFSDVHWIHNAISFRLAYSEVQASPADRMLQAEINSSLREANSRLNAGEFVLAKSELLKLRRLVPQHHDNDWLRFHIVDLQNRLSMVTLVGLEDSLRERITISENRRLPNDPELLTDRLHLVRALSASPRYEQGDEILMNCAQRVASYSDVDVALVPQPGSFTSP